MVTFIGTFAYTMCLDDYRQPHANMLTIIDLRDRRLLDFFAPTQRIGFDTIVHLKLADDGTLAYFGHRAKPNRGPFDRKIDDYHVEGDEIEIQSKRCSFVIPFT